MCRVGVPMAISGIRKLRKDKKEIESRKRKGDDKMKKNCIRLFRRGY